jgi:hypothetical protein
MRRTIALGIVITYPWRYDGTIAAGILVAIQKL